LVGELASPKVKGVITLMTAKNVKSPIGCNYSLAKAPRLDGVADDPPLANRRRCSLLEDKKGDEPQHDGHYGYD
jgi:hypothetical protein